MKIPHPPSSCRSAGGGIVVLTGLLATVAQAHPGHHHPDETDEFDLMQSLFFHPHGSLDWVLAMVLVASLVLACLHGRPSVRIGAVAVAAGSLMLLPIL